MVDCGELRPICLGNDLVSCYFELRVEDLILLQHKSKRGENVF